MMAPDDIKGVRPVTTGRKEADLIEKIRSLPPAKVAEVEDFVDFLYQRESQRHADSAVAARLSEKAFAQIWENSDDAEYDRL